MQQQGILALATDPVTKISETTQTIWVDTAGSYSVQATEPAGCIRLDTIDVVDSAVTRIAGQVLNGLSNPAYYTDVYLIWYNPLDTSLHGIDTTATDFSGNFSFDCPFTYGQYYIKADPDSSFHSTSMPTYYGNQLLFQNAIPYDPNAKERKKRRNRNYLVKFNFSQNVSLIQHFYVKNQKEN